MLASSKVTKKNQTTLPRVVLTALGLKPSDRLVYEIEEGRVVLLAKTERLAELRGRFHDRGARLDYPVSVEEMHDTVTNAVAEKARPYEKKRKMAKKS